PVVTNQSLDSFAAHTVATEGRFQNCVLLTICGQAVQRRRCSDMRSVPPRGSGWVLTSNRSSLKPTSMFERLLPPPIDTDFLVSHSGTATHPLPRGGTDLMSPRRFCFSFGELDDAFRSFA